MGRGNPNIKPRYEKGVSGNPRGRQKEPPEYHAIKKLTKHELIEVGAIIVKGNIEDLKKVKEDPNASVIKMMIASVAARIIAKGDYGALDMILNRLIGKVKDEIEHSGSLASPPQVVITMPDNGRSIKNVTPAEPQKALPDGDIDLGF